MYIISLFMYDLYHTGIHDIWIPVLGKKLESMIFGQDKPPSPKMKTALWYVLSVAKIWGAHIEKTQLLLLPGNVVRLEPQRPLEDLLYVSGRSLVVWDFPHSSSHTDGVFANFTTNGGLGS